MNYISSYLREIQRHATEKTQNAVVMFAGQAYRHQGALETSQTQHPEPSRNAPTNLISRWIHNLYFEGYAQGCEESRRVNFAQGYVEGYKKGRLVGRIQAAGFLFAIMYANNRFFK